MSSSNFFAGLYELFECFSFFPFCATSGGGKTISNFGVPPGERRGVRLFRLCEAVEMSAGDIFAAGLTLIVPKSVVWDAKCGFERGKLESSNSVSFASEVKSSSVSLGSDNLIWVMLVSSVGVLERILVVDSCELYAFQSS